MPGWKLLQLFVSCYFLTVVECYGQTFDYDAAKLIYSSGGQRSFKDNEIEKEFASALKQQKPIVLFVHGRGTEPNKSLNGTGLIARWWVEGHAVRKLESTYGVTVYLFSWDSARLGGPGNIKDRSRPLGNTEKASDRLKTVINALYEAKRQLQNPQKIVLLAHSMGSIVAEHYVRKESGKLPPGVFDNVVLTGADANNLGHKIWVDQLGEWSHTYLVINPNDDTLRKSCDSRPSGMNPLGRDPLGRDLTDSPNPNEGLSTHATYFWFGSPNKETRAHEIFYRDDWKGFDSLKEFFTASLRGQQPSVKTHIGARADKGCSENRWWWNRAWDWVAPPS